MLVRNVKFYNTDILHTEQSGNELYTLDKDKKSEIYFRFLDYIHDVFENRSSDMDFWIKKFLSLERIETPDELSTTLRRTNEHRLTNNLARNRIRDIMIENKVSSLYPYLRHHSAQFNRAPSDSAVYYFNNL